MLGLGYAIPALALRGSARRARLFDFTGPALPAGTMLQRDSAGWSFDATGDLIAAAADVPRFAHDPVTLAPRGLLLEAAGSNLMTNAAASTATWTLDSADASNLALAALGLFGGVQIISTGQSWGRLRANAPMSSGLGYAITVLFRAASSPEARLTLSIYNVGESHFGGPIGAMAQTRGDIGNFGAAQQVLLADGVTRMLRVQFTPSTGGSISLGLGPASSVAGQAVVLLAMQVEQGAAASSFIVSQGGALVRAAEQLQIGALQGPHDLHVTWASGAEQVLAAQQMHAGYVLAAAEPGVLRIRAQPV